MQLGLGFEFSGFGFQLQGFVFRVRVSFFGFPANRSRVWDLGSRGSFSDCRISRFGFRVSEISGFRVHGVGVSVISCSWWSRRGRSPCRHSPTPARASRAPPARNSCIRTSHVLKVRPSIRRCVYSSSNRCVCAARLYTGPGPSCSKSRLYTGSLTRTAVTMVLS